MVPSGSSTPVGGAQPVPSSLLRSNSGMLGGQGGPMPSQGAFPSLMPPRPHYNNVNLLGNIPNAPSILNQSYGNGIVNPGLLGSNGQRGRMDNGAEPDPLSGVGAGTGIGFNPSPASFVPTKIVNAVSPSQVQGQQFLEHSGNQVLADQQQHEPYNFKHPRQPMQQFSAPLSNQPQQLQSNHGGLGGMGQVKLESQVNNDQHVQQQQQQLQSLRALGPVKLEAQQLQPMRNQPHVKTEPQPSEHSILLHQQQQQQQQQLLQLSRQSSQAAAASQLNLLQQHRLLQLQQQQQQQQLLKTLPQQRAQMQQQVQAQNLPMRSPVKPLYEVGACARRLTQFMHQQQNRPEDNNIEFWRKFVADFFAPNSKKKWCVSMYGSGRQTTGVFPQDVWHCEICNRKPGRGFEATFEVLPRLLKIKYESGTLEELLYVDMPREYHNPSGQIVLDYAKAIQESVFDQLRVVRDGQLRIVFSPDLKIYSWEFCARRHEELIPRKLLIPQVSQLGGAAQKYQASTQNASSNSSVPDLQSNCNMFLSSAKQLVKCLEVPLVNDLGYTKRYVRCLQISEVVNSMKDLIDYSRISGTGPMESLAKFPRRANASSGFQTQNQSSENQLQQQSSPQQQQQQQHMIQKSNNEQASTSQATDMQLVPSNGLPSVNNTLNPSITSTYVSTISGHQNSMVSRPHNPMNSTSSPYAQTLPSPGSSNAMQPPPPSQSNPPTTVSNHFQLQPPSNNPLSNTTTHMNRANSPANLSMQQQQQSPLLSNGDPTDSQSSVQQIIQEMMLSGQGRMGDMKVVNGIHPSNNPGLNGPNCMTNSNPSFGFADMGSGMGQAAMLNGARTANGSNPMTMNGRVGMASVGRDQAVGYHRQQDPSNQLLSGFGSVNGFDSFQFDWKPSP